MCIMWSISVFGWLTDWLVQANQSNIPQSCNTSLSRAHLSIPDGNSSASVPRFRTTEIYHEEIPRFDYRLEIDSGSRIGALTFDSNVYVQRSFTTYDEEKDQTIFTWVENLPIVFIRNCKCIVCIDYQNKLCTMKQIVCYKIFPLMCSRFQRRKSIATIWNGDQTLVTL